MDKEEISRRFFLSKFSAGMSAAWLATHWPEIVAAQEHAHRAAQASAPAKFEFFSSEQAAEVEAIAEQIIPAAETPGAREARVIYFIDRALTTFDSDKQKLYLAGLKQLQSKLKKLFHKVGKFSDLSGTQQIELLKAVEKTAFFEQIRTHTIMGFFANPEYGGNHNLVGWKLIGFEDQFLFQPPFGHYDRDYQRER